MEIISFIIMTFLGFVAGFIGTTVGGMGLLTIPFLIFLGSTPEMAVGTNRVGSLGMSAGMYNFHKAKKIDYKIGISLSVITLIFGLIGAYSLLIVPDYLLEKIFGFVIILFVLVVYVNKDFGVKRKKQSKFTNTIGYFCFCFIGFWIGFFGGGWAIMSNMTMIYFFGKTLLESAATRKIIALVLNVSLSIFFIYIGLVTWYLAFALFLGKSTGSYWGSNHGLKKGDVWVRKLFIIVVLITAVKLFF